MSRAVSSYPFAVSVLTETFFATYEMVEKYRLLVCDLLVNLLNPKDFKRKVIVRIFSRHLYLLYWWKLLGKNRADLFKISITNALNLKTLKSTTCINHREDNRKILTNCFFHIEVWAKDLNTTMNLRQQLKEKMSEFSENHQKIIQMSIIEGESDTYVADLLDFTIEDFKRELAVVKFNLREKLKKEILSH